MRKKITLVFAVALFALGIYIVSFDFSKHPISSNSSDNTISIASSNTDSNIKTVSSSLDIMALNLNELSSVSEIIIKGKAIEQTYYTIDTQVFTKTKIKVEKVYKGNVKKSDILNIVEWGGITTGDKFSLKILEEKTGKKPTEEEKEKAKLTKIRVLSGGIPYSEVGKSSVYFMEKASTGEFSNEIDNNTYTPIGVQGRFDIKNTTNNSNKINDSISNSVSTNIDSIERPRGKNNALPELKITEPDLEKAIKK